MSFELFCLAALSFQIAHSHIAVKFSESEISPLLFSCFGKKQLEIYLKLLRSVSRYKDILTKSLLICQVFFEKLFQLRLVNFLLHLY